MLVVDGLADNKPHTHQLRGQLWNGVNTKPKFTADEEFIKWLTKVTDNHCIETGFCAKPVNMKDASPLLSFR